MRTNSWESMMADSDDGSSSNRSDGSWDGRFEEDSENDGFFRRSDELYFSEDSLDMPGYWGSDRRRGPRGGRRRNRRREESEDEEDPEDEESDEEEDEEDPEDEESDEEEEDEANEDSVEVLEPQNNVEVIELDDSSEEQPQGSSEDEYQEYKGSSEEEKEDSKAEVIELSTDEEPDRPHFTVEVKRRNIGTNNGVRVPAAFARKYIPRKTSRIKTMTLRTNLPEAGPREFTLDYKFEKHKKCRVELGHGWQRFQIVNDLEVGTRLTFILQDQTRQRYDVDIERPDNSAEI